MMIYLCGKLLSNIYNCIKSVPHTFNSHVSTGTNPTCIYKAIHMLLMHRYGSLNILVPGHYISRQPICLMVSPGI